MRIYLVDKVQNYRCKDCGYIWKNDFVEDIIFCPQCSSFKVEKLRQTPKYSNFHGGIYAKN